MGEDAPEDWRKEFIRSPKLPAEMSPEPEAAWVELVGLIGREDFVGETREQTEPLWGALRERGIDASSWHERMADIGERARKAVEEGATQESAEVQEIVADRVALFARASGEPVTPDFVRRFARMVPRWAQDADATTRRIKALLSQLDVEHEASQEEGERLMVEGLNWKVGRES
jgi:hypothetical protein